MSIDFITKIGKRINANSDIKSRTDIILEIKIDKNVNQGSYLVMEE